MLRSMTGQGQAQQDGPLGTFSVELRTVNNRGLKVSPRLGDALGRFEPRIEATVRGHVHRGSVQLNANWKRVHAEGSYRIDTHVVAGYFRQLEKLRAKLGAAAPIDLTRLATLPGVIVDAASEAVDDEVVWSFLESALVAALEDLNAMRATEGEAMERQLQLDLERISEEAAAVAGRAPQVVEGYRDRMRTKVAKVLAQEGLEVAPGDLLREVQLFADRSDISEELTRLESHVELFRETISGTAASGRKLDFVIQEMFRETNTIGSKASDAEIARHVVEMKCALERMRELVQNVE
ncbi:YicC/YloC family endoribonuclease [Candidatus Laterigemmans baculatus]|uniref:YicC/YloC family endoribonuclease n=1 Tax=Candidatus Laterigemmans baculatus TaxID=2770505 RepID=UPI0013DD16C0|nr:YicC/YloC family endoribonuclease [Candidatus Laterigemmans baculatus]